MDVRAAVFALVFVGGLGLVWYGVTAVPTQSHYYVTVDGEVDRNDVSADRTIIEYETLTPATQEAFEQAVETREQIALGDAPREFTTGYVHYRGTYYRSTLVVGDLDQTRQFLVAGTGVVLLLIATVGWALNRCGPKRGEGETPSEPA